MTRRFESFFTIGRKLGLMFTVLVGLIAIVSADVVVTLHTIRADAEKLLEETREAALSSQLWAELQTLQGQIQLHRASNDLRGEAGIDALERIARIRGLLDELDEGPPGHRDPSRGDHQAAESQLTATMREDLDGAEALLSDPGEDGGESQGLERSVGYAGVLAVETREEAIRANDDLVARTRTAANEMLATVVAVALALCVSLWFVRRTIVLPLRALRRRADRVGRGEVLDDVRVRSRDEIGALFSAFDVMAQRVARTQEDLQDRVETRTRELFRAARYADIGVLAAGVAHEINNPLASIASCAEGLERRLSSGDVPVSEQLDYLRTIASESYRAKDITSRLLALSRQDRRPAAPVNLADVVQQVELMVRHQLEAKDVRLVVEAPREGPVVSGDAGELLQMIVNLALNARDASPSGGVVRLRVDRVGDDLVEIVVDDEGTGVPEELADRIFDPFFTTKDPGRGTGLGLALVASIVEAHRGEIHVGRSPSKGARFTVRLGTRAEEEA